MGWGSAAGILFTSHCLAAISTRWQYSYALLAAENNSESASKGLPFNWAEHLPKWFLSWRVSPPRMRRTRSLPSRFFSAQPINQCKIWLIVSVLSHALYFHNGLFAHVFANISTSLHKLADAQSAGACDMIPCRSLCSCLAVPCLQGGHGKAQMHLTWHKLLQSRDKNTCPFRSNLLSCRRSLYWERKVKSPLCFLLCHRFNCLHQLLHALTQDYCLCCDSHGPLEINAAKCFKCGPHP